MFVSRRPVGMNVITPAARCCFPLPHHPIATPCTTAGWCPPINAAPHSASWFGRGPVERSRARAGMPHTRPNPVPASTSAPRASFRQGGPVVHVGSRYGHGAEHIAGGACPPVASNRLPGIPLLAGPLVTAVLPGTTQPGTGACSLEAETPAEGNTTTHPAWFRTSWFGREQLGFRSRPRVLCP